jgi:hypothetical protein
MDPLEDFIRLLKGLRQSKDNIEELRDLVLEEGMVVGYSDFIDALLVEMSNVSERERERVGEYE